MKDVALLAVNVVQQSDTSGAVRVVLDGSDLCRHAVLVALEVDDAVTTLHAAALMTDGDVTVVVATRLLVQRRKQGLFRLVAGDFGLVRNRLEATTGASRPVLFDSHFKPFHLDFRSHASPCTGDPSYRCGYGDCQSTLV